MSTLCTQGQGHVRPQQVPRHREHTRGRHRAYPCAPVPPPSCASSGGLPWYADQGSGLGCTPLPFLYRLRVAGLSANRAGLHVYGPRCLLPPHAGTPTIPHGGLALRYVCVLSLGPWSIFQATCTRTSMPCLTELVTVQ